MHPKLLNWQHAGMAPIGPSAAVPPPPPQKGAPKVPPAPSLPNHDANRCARPADISPSRKAAADMEDLHSIAVRMRKEMPLKER